MNQNQSNEKGGVKNVEDDNKTPENFPSTANKPEFQYGIWNELSHMHTNKVAFSAKHKLPRFLKAFESHEDDQ